MRLLKYPIPMFSNFLVKSFGIHLFFRIFYDEIWVYKSRIPWRNYSKFCDRFRFWLVFSLYLQPLTELLCKGCVLNHNEWPHVVPRVGLLSESLYSTLTLFLLVQRLHSTRTHTCASPPSCRRALKTANRLCCASSAWKVVNRESESVLTLRSRAAASFIIDL